MAIVSRGINFKEVRKSYGSDGSPLAACEFVFDLDAREVVVEVQATVANIWNVSEPEIKRACELLVEDALSEEAGRVRARLPLRLDEHTVKPIAEKLGWKRRGR